MLQSEGLLARERLSHMKAKLRISSAALVENYKSPEDLAQQVTQDLNQQIADDFPEDFDAETISNIDQNIAHEFESSTLEGFHGRQIEMNLLDERVLGIQSYNLPTVVTGKQIAGR